MGFKASGALRGVLPLALLGNDCFESTVSEEENSLSSVTNSMSSARNSVSSLWHTNNRLKGTHRVRFPELSEPKKAPGEEKLSTSTVAALFSQKGLDRRENRYGRYGVASFSSISISSVGVDGVDGAKPSL